MKTIRADQFRWSLLIALLKIDSPFTVSIDKSKEKCQHRQIFCPSRLCLGRFQVPLSWFANKNVNVILCPKTEVICTQIIHPHSYMHTLIHQRLYTAQYWFRNPSHASHYPLPVHATTYHLSFTFISHHIHKYTRTHMSLQSQLSHTYTELTL